MYLLQGYGREKTSHIPFLIICSRYLSLYYLMSITGFTSLGITLNVTEPSYLVNVSSVFIFSLRLCKWNWTLWIGTLQLLNYSLYWSPGTIQPLYFLDQAKQFILEYGSISDQVTIDPWSYLYNSPHSGPYFLASDNFTMTINLFLKTFSPMELGCSLLLPLELTLISV